MTEHITPIMRAFPISDDPTDCECERWRNGADWCPYHGESKPPEPPKPPRYVTITITEIEPEPENAKERGIIWPRVLWRGTIPIDSETEIVLPSHDPRRPNAIHATELNIRVEDHT